MDENRDIKKSFVRAPILYWFLIAVLLLLAPKPKVGRRNANDLELASEIGRSPS